MGFSGECLTWGSWDESSDAGLRIHAMIKKRDSSPEINMGERRGILEDDQTSLE
jgi:hypothetical protein